MTTTVSGRTASAAGLDPMFAPAAAAAAGPVDFAIAPDAVVISKEADDAHPDQ